MTTTVFQDNVTPVPAAWLNDVNVAVYTTVPSYTTLVANETARALAAEALLAPLTNANLVNPNLGTPSAVVLTNATGTAALLSIGGFAATATTVTTTISSGAVATTQAITDNSTKVATTAFIKGLFTPITASLVGANVALNNTANFFDGPSIAQGTTGTWFVSGNVTLSAGVSQDKFFVKLWDGTSVLASCSLFISATLFNNVSLSGFISSPAGNLRISVRDVSATDGVMYFNDTGNSKDSTITAIRIG